MDAVQPPSQPSIDWSTLAAQAAQDIPPASSTTQAAVPKSPSSASATSQATAAANPALAAGGDAMSAIAQKLGMQAASNSIAGITSNTADKVAQYVDTQNKGLQQATAGTGGGAPTGSLSQMPGAANANVKYQNPGANAAVYSGGGPYGG